VNRLRGNWERSWAVQRRIEAWWGALDAKQQGVVVMFVAWMFMVRLWLPLGGSFMDMLMLLVCSAGVIMVALVALALGLIDF